MALVGNRTDGEPFEMRGVALFDLREDRIAAARLYMEPVEHDGEPIEGSVENLSGELPLRHDLQPVEPGSGNRGATEQ